MDEVLLAAPPGDGISSIAFSPFAADLLLLSSWDSTARLYNVIQNMPKFTFNFMGASLTCCFDASSSTTAYSGGLDESVYCLDLNRGSKTIIGKHNQAISTSYFSSSRNLLFTGSWDKSVLAWDQKSSSSSSSHVIQVDGKVYSISGSENRLVIASSNHEILVYDIRNLSSPEQIRESPLRHQIRKVACDKVTHSRFTIGSVEGRCALEYYDMSEEMQSLKYAFKCHRKDDRAYPVNTIAFHPIYGTFATGGCDGVVNIWDGTNRKRLAQFQPYPTSIAAIDFR